ncbi:MAG: Methyltransferase FkbM family [Parcubacteria group bacterium GW2011_GWD2_38_11]|nr:MAG: Methyltransferase FkbM family [Parcubacteria group bacterium GW2011_GWD2_38_11]
MKTKLFQLIYRVLKFLNAPLKNIIKLSNFVNLIIFSFFSKGKYIVRDESSFMFAESFVKYYLLGGSYDENKFILDLKKDLDETSCVLVDEILKRFEYIYTHSLMDTDQFFNQEELKEQSLLDRERKSKNNLPGFVDEVISFYHNGLKLLPAEVKKSLIGTDVVDAGAFWGDSSVIFNKEYDFHKIYAFEPEKNNFSKLVTNIKENNLSNVLAVEKGVGDFVGQIKIKSQGPGSYVGDAGDESINIVTIDDFVGKNNANIGLIKMDIEGSEYNAVLGATETIKKFKPVLVISIYHRGKDFFEIKPYLESLDCGYEFVIRKFNPYSLAQEIMLIAYINK